MEQKQNINQHEDEVRAYNILLQRHTNDDRLMGERSFAFLAGSSILFLGFVMLLQFFPISRILCTAIPILGLLLCLFAIFSNGRTKKGLNFWTKCEEWLEKNGSSFDYMREKRKMDTREMDMLPSSVKEHVGLFKIKNRIIYTWIVPGIFLALWVCSLIWLQSV